ncbi:outer membrane lipid asymmetry maintenance protein MlaD [Chitinilyticum piscinae]|uniref:Outer membrane lipid asymmetry maintenance protein MlaD n=1 Tax=Chitinilyticum piscinae TaxID=2866724 RepID=A0A8J7FUW1_9NEIS|nr:outer membrane lipid asymmetry maintenance protein MlaD [Chitinilyticum piscinae]MBE9607760.1 outer membrane lipid asymmetry maintenance protein MlaD [Chitinilyticum piscinae]
MKRGLIDFWVGLFVLVGLAAILFLALRVSTVSGQPAGSSYTITATFDNIGGLKVRAPVKSAGVLVGRVDSIDLDTERYLAKVTLSINQRYRFSRDSSAEILTSGLLGEQYIGITSGADDKMLQDGDAFKITSSAIILEQLISRFLFSKAAGDHEATPEK